MAMFGHYQQLKKAEHLSDPKKIGACLTCKFWKVEGERIEAHHQMVALCIQPELALFQLIVSGGSACNRWEKKPGVSKNAERFAERYEND